MRARNAVAVGALLLLPLCGVASGQAPGAPAQASHRKGETRTERPRPREVLSRGQIVRFPLPGPTAVLAGGGYCDAEGNAYLMYTAAKPVLGPGPIIPPSVEGQSITRLSLGSQEATHFAPGSVSGYTSLLFLGVFAVSRWGRVYGVYQAHPSPVGEEAGRGAQRFIVSFNGDGTVDSTVRLRNPAPGQLDPLVFAPFADGSLFVAGITHPPPPPPGAARENGTRRIQIVRSRPAGFREFAGVFDHYGRFLVGVQLPKGGGQSPPVPGRSSAGATAGGKAAMAPLPKPWVEDMLRSIAVPGPANTVYLLRPSTPPRLYTLSSTGEVTSAVSVHPPQPNATAVGMSLAGRGAVLITYFGTARGAKGALSETHTYALVDPGTGKLLGAYRLPKDAGVMPLCAAGRNDFLFIGSTKHDKLKIVSYRAR